MGEEEQKCEKVPSVLAFFFFLLLENAFQPHLNLNTKVEVKYEESDPKNGANLNGYAV